jgi:hypothetical protein
MAQAGRKTIGPERNIRFADADWARLAAAAAAADRAAAAAHPGGRRHRTDRSTVLRQLAAWYAGTGELPRRPPAADVERELAARADAS